MEWSELAWLVHLGRSDSIANAARALGVAPSTLYRRLDKVEAELGLPLFDRRQGVLRPTDAGALVIAAGEEVATRMAALQRDLEALQDAASGRVVLAAPEALALGLMDALLGFHRAHPDLSVEVVVGADLAALSRGEADVALRVSADPGDGLVGRRVGPVSVAVYGTQAGRGTFDASRHPWVCFDDSLSHTAQGRWEAKNVPPERVRMRVASRTLFLEAVRAGVGVGMLPCAMANRQPGLFRLTEPFTDSELTLWVLCHPAVRDLPKVRALMDFLVQNVLDAYTA